jgi:hypothetical protein
LPGRVFSLSVELTYFQAVSEVGNSEENEKDAKRKETPGGNRLTKALRSVQVCNWDRIDADGPQWPYCANPTTKEFAPPIYFLHAESLKCPEF